MKTISRISIRNLFRILMYAWEDMDLADAAELDLDGIDSQGNLLAAMYTRVLQRLVRCGLRKTYEEKSDQLGVIRGRLELWPTVSRHLNRAGKVYCTWTELDCDGPLNRALRTTADNVLRTLSLDEKVAEDLMSAAESMHGVSLDGQSLSALHGFVADPVHSHYVPAVTIARLLTDLLLPDQQTGELGLQDLFRNEKAMHNIFERFARRFFRYRYQSAGWDIAARSYDWSTGKKGPRTGFPVPTLNTDITMRHSKRAVVIDTKYYKSKHQKSQFNDSLRSSHLFQIYAYLRAEEERNGLPVHGVLLYARPDGEDLDQWIDLRGIPVRMFGLDLNQSWEGIESDLCSLTVPHRDIYQ